MGKRMVMIFTILIIVLGGGFYAYKQLFPPAVEEVSGPVYSTQEVKKGDISVGVETSGQLNPTAGGGIRVPEAGDPSMYSVQYIIDQFLVEEGDVVSQGEVVAKLVSTDLQGQLDGIRTKIETKKEELAQLTGLTVDEVGRINASQGLNITAPISGKVVNLTVTAGKELSQGELICSIVDDSKYKVRVKLTAGEFKKVKVGQKVKLRFPYFDGSYDATFVEINPNGTPNDSEDGFGTSFVHWATIEGENPGLIQSNMKVTVGIPSSEGSSSVNNLIYEGTVEGFVNEKKVFNQLEAVATEVHINDMQMVEKGDTMITMAGSDIREMLQEKLNEISDLQMDLNKLLSTLNQLEIKAPMDGVVAGTYRQPGESVRAGEWIGDIYNTDKMRMYTQVDDIDVLHVKQDAPVRVTVDALPGETFEGTVYRVTSMMGRDNTGITRFSVEIEMNGGPQLRPGMQAKAFIDAGSAEDVLLVPLEAIFEEDGISKVEVLNPDGTTKVVSIKIGLMNDRVAEVQSGLKEGDLVITGSTADLLPSQSIKSNDSILPSTPDEGNEDKNGGSPEPAN